MSRHIAVLSCESTGTHFTQFAIQRLVNKPLAWGAWGQHGIVQHVYPVGFDRKADGMIEEAVKNAIVVVPMRHPVKAIITNYEHSRVTDRYPNPFPNHARSFGRVAGWQDRDNVMYFQVDRPDPLFKELAAHVGAKRMLPLSNQARNETPSRKHTALRQWFHDKEWDKLDEHLDGAVTILRDYADFFDQFGYERW